jgi:hypothetical protein
MQENKMNSSRTGAPGREHVLKAANFVQLIWEQSTDRWLRINSQSSDVPCSDYLRDWSRVHTRLDPSNCGSVRIDGWLDLAQHVIFAPTENLKVSEEWQPSSRDEFCFMAVLVWFSLDTRENGELLTSLFLAWLRRLAVAPTTPIHEISDVHLMVDRGCVFSCPRSVMFGNECTPLVFDPLVKNKAERLLHKCLHGHTYLQICKEWTYLPTHLRCKGRHPCGCSY